MKKIILAVLIIIGLAYSSQVMAQPPAGGGLPYVIKDSCTSWTRNNIVCITKATKAVCIGNGSACVDVGGGSVSDVAYDATTWDNVTTVSPSKNAVRDKVETLLPKSGGTMTGKIVTLTPAAGASGYASINFPPGAAPTTNIANGDCWTTSAGLYCYINGATIGPYAIASTQAFLHIDDILTALGIASEATSFGTFTGSTIPDTSTAKAALQALETALELKATAADYVPKSLYDAYTILYADSDNTPAPLTVAASTIVGRKSTAGIAALTAAETRTILGIDKGYSWIPAGAMTPITSAGLATVSQSPNMTDYLAFDGATDEYAAFTISPEDWDLGTIKAKFVWYASAAMTNGHTVIWGLNCYAVSDGDTSDVAFNAGEVTVSDAYVTADETGPIQKTTAATASITVQGTPVAGDVVYCRVPRRATTDTSEIDAWLVGVKIEYGKTGPTAW